MQNLLHTIAEAAIHLMAALAPVAVLLLVVTACANANRVRLTVAAERLPPLRVLLWLGVAVHEGGHLLACLLTLTRVRHVQIKWHSGFVKHDARGPLASAVIATGPILSATLLAVVTTAWLFGAEFALAAAPFRSPLSAELSLWTQRAMFSLGQEIWRLLCDRGVVHVPLMLVLAGMLSSAAPSPPDLRNAVPGLAWAALAAVAAEAACTFLGSGSLLPLAQPLLHEVTGALGIASFACLIGALLIFPLTAGLRKR